MEKRSKTLQQLKKKQYENEWEGCGANEGSPNEDSPGTRREARLSENVPIGVEEKRQQNKGKERSASDEARRKRPLLRGRVS